MTATPVAWVLDELGSVVDAQPTDHPLRRVDRDNALLYDGGGTFDMSQSIRSRTADLEKANYVGARYAAPTEEYIGTNPNLDSEHVVGIRIEGYSGGFGHIDPLGNDGVVFNGTDNSLVQQIKDALRDQLKFPDAGRTNVAYTHLTITNQSPAMADWDEYHRYDMDVLLSGYETL